MKSNSRNEGRLYVLMRIRKGDKWEYRSKAGWIKPANQSFEEAVAWDKGGFELGIWCSMPRPD